MRRSAWFRVGLAMFSICLRVDVIIDEYGYKARCRACAKSLILNYELDLDSGLVMLQEYSAWPRLAVQLLMASRRFEVLWSGSLWRSFLRLD